MFDLVYSKGVLNHVIDKKDLFIEINRVLKPGGLFVIADWIFSEITNDNESNPLAKETQETYLQALEYAGFTNISFRNDSQIFLIYVKKLLENLRLHRDTLEKNFGTGILSIIMNDHRDLVRLINDQKR